MLSKPISSFGSWKTNLKNITVIGALLYSSLMGSTSGEISHYKMRIHKNFIKDIIDKNF